METQFLRHVAFGVVIWATLLLYPSTCSKPCSFPAIFNFGDSNSDTGGLSATFGQAPYPNGETYFRTPSGRYSDGRLIIDFIGIFPTPVSFIFLFPCYYVTGFISCLILFNLGLELLCMWLPFYEGVESVQLDLDIVYIKLKNRTSSSAFAYA